MFHRGTPWRRPVQIAVDPVNDDMRLRRLLRGKALKLSIFWNFHAFFS